MSRSPFPRRLLFADGPDSLYPNELPTFLALGRSVASDRHFLFNEKDRAAHVYMCGITGSGKSRLLESMIIQDLCCQRPVCLIDPTAGLYRKILDFVAYAVEIAERRGHDPEHLLKDYLFLDIDSAANPFRVNPLEPQGDETTEEQVDDFLKVAERLFGSIDAMRRVRNNLRNSCWVIAELNRLPLQDRPAVDGFEYPLNLRFAAHFLSESDEYRTNLVERLPDTPLNDYVRTYWMRFFAQFTPSQKQERLESTWNILQYFLGDALVNRFFDTDRSTLDIPGLLRTDQSLFSSLPIGKNLKGCQLIGTFLATKLQRAAYRRPQAERRPYYLYIDEFHEFADLDFAKASTTLRQYELRMILAHQSQSQPPFHTPEGRSFLDTIKGNARAKVLFRLSREDAETMSREMFVLSQRRHNFTYSEISVARGQTLSTTRSVAFQRSQSRSLNWSRSISRVLAQSETCAVAEARGVSLGNTLTAGFGEQISEGISRTITESESETLTEMQSRTHGISVLLGKNWSHTASRQRGFSYSTNESESLAIQQGTSTTQTKGEQTGETSTQGHDLKITDGNGNSLVQTQGQTAYHEKADSASSTSNALSSLHQHSKAHGSSYSSAIQSLRSVATAIGRSSGRTTTRQATSGRDQSHGEAHAELVGGTESRTDTQSETMGRSLGSTVGTSEARGTTLGFSRSQELALAQAFSQMAQLTDSFSKALQRSVSRSLTSGESAGEGESTTRSASIAESDSDTDTVSERKTFFSLEGEREITVNDLQRLPIQHCVVAKDALAAVEIETYYIPGRWYSYRERDYPTQILQRQQRLYAAPTLTSPSVEPVSELPEDEPVEDELWGF